MSDLPTVEFVTDAGERRRVSYERGGAATCVVRREFRHDGDEWVPVGVEELRSLEIDGEPRMPVSMRALLTRD